MVRFDPLRVAPAERDVTPRDGDDARIVAPKREGSSDDLDHRSACLVADKGLRSSEVPAGSVAIADGQTSVYPFDSPGGWRLIGRTDVRVFDSTRDSPALIRPGDRVRFVAR